MLSMRCCALYMLLLLKSEELLISVEEDVDSVVVHEVRKRSKVHSESRIMLRDRGLGRSVDRSVDDKWWNEKCSWAFCMMIDGRRFICVVVFSSLVLCAFCFFDPSGQIMREFYQVFWFSGVGKLQMPMMWKASNTFFQNDIQLKDLSHHRIQKQHDANQIIMKSPQNATPSFHIY